MASEAQATQFTTTFPAVRARGRSVTEHTARVGTWLRQALCGLNGHDRYLHVDGTRVTLRCVGCQHDSPGWETGDRAYQRTYAGDPLRHRIRQ
ncbi:hypothetical protein [Luteitalea sp.]